MSTISTSAPVAQDFSLHEPVPAGYSERLYNHDLAPVKERNWSFYSLFCMWMADVHSIGGYIFAAGLFFLGLSGWQVFSALLLGIGLVYYFMNFSGIAGQRNGIPFPVLARISFGVYGANLPALIRAIMAIFWYGIQTWLASVALVVLAVTLWPDLNALRQESFLGLSTLGWICFMGLWLAQLLVLNHGMESVRRLVDWAGPAIYVAMAALALWIFAQAGWEIDLNLGSKELTLGGTVLAFATAMALVVNYFSTLMLNFCDFSRFSPSERMVKLGNFWGLPVNFLFFAVLVVVTTSSSIAVYGEAVTDPVELVARIPNTLVIIIAAVTFAVATVGINIVANFVSASYDLSNLAPKYISFKRGGLLTSVFAVLLTPWNVYNSPLAVNYFLGGLGAFLGPLFGIIFVDYYRVKKGRVDMDSLYQAGPQSEYWYRGGVNPNAIKAFVPAAAVSAVFALAPAFQAIAPFSWFIGAGISAVLYSYLAERR